MGKTRPRDIGTVAESAVLKVIAQYWPTADRAPLRGNLDQGDILGTPYVWEIKGGHAAESASDGQITNWLRETEIELANAQKAALIRGNPEPPFGFLVCKRKGVGPANAHDWWVWMFSCDLHRVLGAPEPSVFDYFPVRMRLGDLLHILGRASAAA